MVVFNYSGAEINAKVVYYGPALSGKTTNLECIHEKMPADAKGKMVSMKTRTDRTLFFDFLPLELGEISGYRTRILLYTVPGQVYYNATRKLVLKGVDAVVFVADSAPDKLQENIESLRNLEENLNEHSLSLDSLPWVIQYNKRDVPRALPIPHLEEKLNLLGVPSFEAVATTGGGIYETFQGIAGILYNRLVERIEQKEAEKHAHASGAPAADSGPAFDSTTEEGGIDLHDMSEVVEVAMREVDKLGMEQPDAPGTPPTHEYVPITGEPAPRPGRDPDDDSESTVGRLVDFDGAAGDQENPAADESDFIRDPFQKAQVAADVGRENRVAVADKPQATERATASEEPLVVSVPVVLTRSQMRKNIPIKLSLEIQVVDDSS